MRVCSNHDRDNRLPRNRCNDSQAACGRPRANFRWPQVQAVVAPPQFGLDTHTVGNTDNTVVRDGGGAVGAVCRDKADVAYALAVWVAKESW